MGGDIDVGFVRALERPDPRLSHQLVAEEDYWLAMPHDHPLSAFDQVPLEALHQTHLLFFPRAFSPHVYDEWIEAFARAKTEPVLIQEVRSLHTELSLVVAGVGVCLMTESVTKGSRPGVVYRKLIGSVPKVRVYMVWNSRFHNPIRTKFISYQTLQSNR